MHIVHEDKRLLHILCCTITEQGKVSIEHTLESTTTPEACSMSVSTSFYATIFQLLLSNDWTLCMYVQYYTLLWAKKKQVR